jgi:hypothetical protein
MEVRVGISPTHCLRRAVPEWVCQVLNSASEPVAVFHAIGRNWLYGAKALIRPSVFGLPHPVARSYPFTAGKPLLPVVMSWKSVL